MNKFIQFFKETSPFTLILISLIISGLTYFIEKPLPSVFLTFRLLAFVLFVFAFIRLFNKK